MKLRTLITLVALAAIVGGAGVVTYRRQAAGWRNEAATFNGGKILDFPINDVAEVTIKGPASTTTLTKQDDGWIVKERDYPADADHVSRLIRTLWDLKAVQDVTAGPSQLSRLQLTESGTLTDLANAQGKRVAALMAGKSYFKEVPGAPPGLSYNAGRYVMPLEGSSRVALVDDNLTDIDTAPEDWLNRSFIQIARIKSIALSGATPATQWKIQRADDKAAWTLADANPGEKLAAGPLLKFAMLLAAPTFTDVLPKSDSGQYPVAMTVETFDGSTYTLKTGAARDNKWPVLVEVTGKAAEKAKQWNGRVFLLSRSTVSSLLKNRSDLLAPNPSPTPAMKMAMPPPPPASPARH